MIIVQTPLRVSLFGGGTDFPSFFLSEGGCVLTTAVDKYIFVAIKQRFDEKLRVGYTQTEIVDRIDEIQHELVREAFRKTGIDKGVEVTTMGDIPAGSGLGSSGTVTVGALHAMHVYRNELVTAEQLAREACQIEIDILKKPVGVQDQYIAAYGGLQFIRFQPSGVVECERIELEPGLSRKLNESLLLFFTGITRASESILGEQNSNIHNHLSILRRLKQMAVDASSELQSRNLDSLGHLLHESWQLKKQLASGVSNPTIENIYQRAREAGALGGKITGAGGGGFFLFYCRPQSREQVREALADLQELPFTLEPTGSSVILNHRH